MNTANAAFLTSYGLSSQLPPQTRGEVVFSGRSNVGKSSLINRLCNRKNLARTSSTPGKTVTINFYEVGNLHFVDLPGYGYAKAARPDRKRWDDLINGYFARTEKGRLLLIQLLDCRHAPSEDDLTMLKYLAHYQIPYVAALTKSDKLKKSQLAQTAESFTEICRPYACKAVFLTSAENGAGIPELLAQIEEYFTQGETYGSECHRNQ